jgi:hypothetical protein
MISTLTTPAMLSVVSAAMNYMSMPLLTRRRTSFSTAG